MKHKYIDGCEDQCGCCNFCNLNVCEVCGEYEAGLTTDCCGRKVTTEETELILNGKLDFIDGKWVRIELRSN